MRQDIKGIRADAPALLAAADRAMGAGDHRGTVELLESYVTIATPRPDDWLRLAAARRAIGDLVGALDAIGKTLQASPHHIVALLMGGSLLQAMGHREEAARTYAAALRQPPPGQALPPRLQQEIGQARAIIEADQKWRHNVSAWQSDSLAGDARACVETFRARILTGRTRADEIELPYPGIAPVRFVDPARLPGIAALERATETIRREYQTRLAAKSDAHTHVAHDGVAARGTWSALHLFLNGELVEDNARYCPETVHLYRELRPPIVPGRSPNLMFSLLDPHTRIPAHRGVSNTRLVLHIPLIVPDQAAIRVGTETRARRPRRGPVVRRQTEHEA